MSKLIALATASLLLTGCGYARHARDQAEFSHRVDADAVACRAGSVAACEAYRIDVQRCSIFSTDPVCQNW
jgi:hypothetical protein